MPTTTRGLPYPAATDPANGPGQFQALAEAVDSYVIGTYTGNVTQPSTWTGTGTGALSNIGSYSINIPTAWQQWILIMLFTGQASGLLNKLQMTYAGSSYNVMTNLPAGSVCNSLNTNTIGNTGIKAIGVQAAAAAGITITNCSYSAWAIRIG